jgi:hypothetical protein
VGLPLSLVLWAARLDQVVPLPAYGSPLAGAIVVLVGAALMAAATAALWVHGGGLPMSPYPPDHFVGRGVYRYLSHPIYTGAVIVSVGVALGLRSPAGLWIVSPLLAATAAAWVLGYERDATRTRFGPDVRPPAFRLPGADGAVPTGSDRASAYALVFLPWLVLYQAVEFLGVPPDAIVAWQAWDHALPVLVWTEPVYLLAYPFALAVPLVVSTRADLRWFMTRGWLAIALIVPLYLLLPIIAPAKPVVGDGVLETLMRWEREYDQPVTAVPAFHVVWALLAARVYARRWTRLAPLWWIVAAAISVSCVTVGMHASVDVLGGLAAFLVIVRAERIWEWVRRAAERVANSWHEVTLGPVRLINHGLYAAAGAWVGMMAAVALAGPGNLWAVIGLAATAVAGAALWAQLVEGSPVLLRPFGYFGSVAGALAALSVTAALGGEVWLLLGAFAVGASLTQAIGRGRCLVQGCCHGAECPSWLGITYAHPRSRVVRLSPFAGRPIHATQLYSAGWMVLVAMLLLRLWILGAGLQLVAGLYFILVGLGRFVEEHYRGEPQTRTWGGFRLYQWLSIGFVAAGASVTAMGWTPAPGVALPSVGGVLAITAFSAVVCFAYGMDFPGLKARFSRLV